MREWVSRINSSWQAAGTIIVGVRSGVAWIQRPSLFALCSISSRSVSKVASRFWACAQASKVLGTVPSTSSRSSSDIGT